MKGDEALTHYPQTAPKRGQACPGFLSLRSVRLREFLVQPGPGKGPVAFTVRSEMPSNLPASATVQAGVRTAASPTPLSPGPRRPTCPRLHPCASKCVGGRIQGQLHFIEEQPLLSAAAAQAAFAPGLIDQNAPHGLGCRRVELPGGLPLPGLLRATNAGTPHAPTPWPGGSGRVLGEPPYGWPDGAIPHKRPATDQRLRQPARRSPAR